MMNIPRGFRLAGVHCGLKQDGQRQDLALAVCDQPCVAAGVYTENIIFAAPVELDRQRTPSANIRAVVVNSGNANACTGERGLRDAQQMTRLVAERIQADPEQVLVMSTGIIGRFLPMEKISGGIHSAFDQLGRETMHLHAAARAILTTDKDMKLACRGIQTGAAAAQITGIAKGAGMIGPQMATMLSLIMTDASLAPEDAQQVLRAAVHQSFNCISVEGHMSTNDTVLLLASGASQDEPLTGSALTNFQDTLTDLCIDLAKQIPDDGEGASHLICIRVSGCRGAAEAKLIAKSVASSNLVKTAIAGNDPNWGRIVSAAGYAGVDFDPRQLRLAINQHVVYEKGTPTGVDEAIVSAAIAASREATIELRFGEGSASAHFWTSDLNVEYVRFNADYHT